MTSRAAKVFAASAVASLAIAGSAQARHGADDAAGHVRHGQGADDAQLHARHGADDPAGHVRRSRGADDAKPHARHRRHRHHARHASFKRSSVEDRNDDRGGRRGGGSDDPAGHR
jgi:hypothetical protein